MPRIQITPEFLKGVGKIIILYCETIILLSKPNVTQLNSTQSNSKQLRWVRHSTHLEPTPLPRTNFSVTSRPARELKFGTDTH